MGGFESGIASLNHGPHGPELYSEILYCRPHGYVIFHSREVTLFGKP
jgi:hypothetical protein